MFTITKEFHFSASHQLTHLLATQPHHPCARLHGHNYVVAVSIIGDNLDSNGFLLDYNDLLWFKTYIDEVLDHRHLNEVFGDSIKTTAENMAQHFHTQISLWLESLSFKYRALRVMVSETPKTEATYECPR